MSELFRHSKKFQEKLSLTISQTSNRPSRTAPTENRLKFLADNLRQLSSETLYSNISFCYIIQILEITGRLEISQLIEEYGFKSSFNELFSFLKSKSSTLNIDEGKYISLKHRSQVEKSVSNRRFSFGNQFISYMKGSDYLLFKKDSANVTVHSKVNDNSFIFENKEKGVTIIFNDLICIHQASPKMLSIWKDIQDPINSLNLYELSIKVGLKMHNFIDSSVNNSMNDKKEVKKKASKKRIRYTNIHLLELFKK